MICPYKLTLRNSHMCTLAPTRVHMFSHMHTLTHVAEGNTEMKLGKQLLTILPKE